MLLKNLRYTNHPLLGDLYLDFTSQSGKAFKNIIIAGENGTGKSFILSEIFSLLKFSHSNEIPIFSEFELNDYELEALKQELGGSEKNVTIGSNPSLTVSYEFAEEESRFYYKMTLLHSQGAIQLSYPSYETQTSSIIRRMLYCSYSGAENSFKTRNIEAVTGQDIDKYVHYSREIAESFPTELAQLFIDIDTKDALDFRAWSLANPSQTSNQGNPEKRLSRFKDAYRKMFPTKILKGIERGYNGKYNVVFKEFDIEMSLDNLSSGEKQIVFRAGFLLKDIEVINGYAILIDEPELSLHPSWQQKIVAFYKGLFSNENGIQTSQIFFATHSPFIVHNHDPYTDKVIVLKKDGYGKIYIDENPSYYSSGPEILIKRAFDIDWINRQQGNVVLTEGETDTLYLNKCAEIFGLNSLGYNVEWVGRKNENNRIEFTGSSALNQVEKFIIANPSMVPHNVMLLFDCDAHKRNSKQGGLFVHSLEQQSNKRFKKGIENMLIFPDNFNFEPFYKKNKKLGDYGEENAIDEFQKVRFCNYICKEIDDELQKCILSNLKLELIKIKHRFENE